MTLRGNLVIGAVLTGAILALALASYVWTPHSAIDIDGGQVGPPAEHLPELSLVAGRGAESVRDRQADDLQLRRRR